jgi:hypothetical protein
MRNFGNGILKYSLRDSFDGGQPLVLFGNSSFNSEERRTSTHLFGELAMINFGTYGAGSLMCGMKLPVTATQII